MKYPKVITHGVLALVLVLVASLTACSLHAQSTATITNVTTNTWKSEVIDSDLPVFVYFYSDNCKPCDQQYPLVEDLAKEYAGKVKFVKIDVVAEHDIRDALSILKVPTMWVYKKADKTVLVSPYNLDKAGLKKFLEDGLAKKPAQP